MFTDEQLVQEIRLRLHEELEDMYPADWVIHVWQQVEHPSTSPTKVVRRPRRLFPVSRSAMGLLVGVAVVVIVVVTALALSGGASRPSTESAPSSEQPLLRILGVLRRPQTRADLPSALVGWLKLESGARVREEIGTPVATGVRLAGVTPAGEKVFLIPDKPATAASISTYIAGLRATRALHPQLRRVQQNLSTLAAQGYNVQIAVMNPDGRVRLIGVQTAQSIEDGDGLGGSVVGRAPRTFSGELILLVPDEVTKVTALLPYGSPAQSRITGRIQHNLLDVSVPGQPDDEVVVGMTWYTNTGQVLRRFGPTSPSTPPSRVSAPITVQVITATRYCYGVKNHVEIACGHRIPPGYKTFYGGAGPSALVNIRYKARLAANNRHSVYEYSYGRVSGPTSCSLNTGGTSGTSMNPIRAGQIVTIQDSSFVCPGTYGGMITYQPNGAPGRDTLFFLSPIHDGSLLVGRFSFVIRKP